MKIQVIEDPSLGTNNFTLESWVDKQMLRCVIVVLRFSSMEAVVGL